MKFFSTPLEPMSSIAAEAEALGIRVDGVDAREQMDSLLRAGQLGNVGTCFPIAGDQPAAVVTDTSVELGRASER